MIGTMRQILRAAAGVAVVVFSGGLQGQSTKAELFGVLHDPSGLPVGGTTVELLHAETQAKWAVQTDPEGNYYFFALPAGRYQIFAAKPGFRRLERGGIVLRVGDQVSLD